MKEQLKAPQKIQLNNKEIANLSDVKFKILVLRVLTEMVEQGCKIKEEVKAMQNAIKEKCTGNQQCTEGNWGSNQ